MKNIIEELKPLFKKYKGRKHPLEYENLYQLLVMVVLTMRNSQRNINSLAPAFFGKFPTVKHLAKATKEDLYPYISNVENFGNKADWLIKLAKEIKVDENIPLTMEELTKHDGVGRRSANIVMMEFAEKMEGIVIGLEALRIVARYGLSKNTNPGKVEQTLMALIPQKYWKSVSIGFIYLGEEICRPTNPKCSECPL